MKKKIIVDNLGIDVKSILDIINYKKIIELERKKLTCQVVIKRTLGWAYTFLL
jgi:hypothetical protein